MNKYKNKCPTLAVIKTIERYKFGGYTTKMWEEGKIQDDKTFVFSLDKKK